MVSKDVEIVLHNQWCKTPKSPKGDFEAPFCVRCKFDLIYSKQD